MIILIYIIKKISSAFWLRSGIESVLISLTQNLKNWASETFGCQYLIEMGLLIRVSSLKGFLSHYFI